MPVALLLLSGCGTTDFHPYVGQQQNWPTSSGAFIKPGTAIPVYYGWPPRPYTVLGFMDATGSRHGVMDLAATKAKELGADAIVVMSRGTVYAGSTGGVAGNVYAGSFYGSSHSHAIYRGKATVLVIKWR